MGDQQHRVSRSTDGHASGGRQVVRLEPERLTQLIPAVGASWVQAGWAECVCHVALTLCVLSLKFKVVASGSLRAFDSARARCVQFASDSRRWIMSVSMVGIGIADWM